jgi:hypothetical protein
MQDSTQRLPSIINIERYLGLKIVINPQSLALSPVEYDMKLTLADVYGNEESINFRVIIKYYDATYSTCYSDSTVVKQPFVLDHIYTIGSLWGHKIHIPNPRT